MQGGSFAEGSAQLASYLDPRHAVASKQLGVAQGEGGAQRERQQEDQGDSGQPAVGNRLPRATGRNSLRPMAAGM